MTGAAVGKYCIWRWGGGCILIYSTARSLRTGARSSSSSASETTCDLPTHLLHAVIHRQQSLHPPALQHVRELHVHGPHGPGVAQDPVFVRVRGVVVAWSSARRTDEDALLERKLLSRRRKKSHFLAGNAMPVGFPKFKTPSILGKNDFFFFFWRKTTGRWSIESFGGELDEHPAKKLPAIDGCRRYHGNSNLQCPAAISALSL